MGILHRNFGDAEAALHPPGFVSADDPASTYGTTSTGVRSGQLWIEHLSGAPDTLEALKIRNDANNGWLDVFGLLGGGTGVDTPSSIATGDLIYGDATDSLAALSIGTTGQVLTVSAGGIPEWAAASGGTIEDPSSVSAGDIVYGISSDVLAALPIGTNDQVLTVVSGLPQWAAAGGGGGGLSAGDTILAADGTTSAPGFAFRSDTNTGIYRQAENAMGVVTGNTERYRFTNSAFTVLTGQQILLPDGSAAAPSIAFTGDTDLGFYNDGANRMSAAVLGSEVMTWFSSGVLVEDGFTFRIPDGTAGNPALCFRGDTDNGLYYVGTNSFGFSTAGVSRMVIASDGGIVMNNLPTSDPGVTGELWNNAGVVNIS